VESKLDPPTLQRAAQILRQGGLVAFPTETVYGLGANALDAQAVQRIFAAKGRPSTNPLIVHVSDASAARVCVSAWPPAAEQLAQAFWPGPLTLVLPKSPAIPDSVTAGLKAVGVRVPRHPVAQELLRLAQVPIAAPSANRSTELSPTRAEHVRRSLGSAVDMILDGGPTTVGIESAVVDLTGAQPRLLRPGSLDPEAIRAVCGELIVPSSVQAAVGVPQLSPGLQQRHYAPRARLVLVEASALAEAVQAARSLRSQGQRIACLSFGTLELEADMRHRFDPEDPLSAARELYGRLHELDQAGVDVVFVELPPSGSAWLGIRDRLQRASAKA
jgi:L-threonylcarbamoyladenylate synthase